jgi:hypothetical protein
MVVRRITILITKWFSIFLGLSSESNELVLFFLNISSKQALGIISNPLQISL